MGGYLCANEKVFVIFLPFFVGIIYFFNIRNGSEYIILESDEMDLRRNILQKACKSHGLDVRGKDALHQPNPWQYVIAKQSDTNLVWCQVHKSGHTR